MLQESNELTATERLFEIELDLARISALIGYARLPLERAYGDEPTQDDADKENSDFMISVQLENLDDVIQELDQLRLDLLDGTQETI